MSPLLGSLTAVGPLRKLVSACTGENQFNGLCFIFDFAFAGIRKFQRQCLDLMGKIRHNLRLHSQSLKPIKMVKKLPDPTKIKKSKLAAGLKNKMKRPKIKKSAKKKAGWTSEAEVSCEWCPGTYSRWVFLS